MNQIPCQRLVVFTRYPDPGKTKTRLIPALGAEGAATLQRQMTERTLAQARQWLQTAGANAQLEIRFAGGDRSLMRQWLGDDLAYEPQGDGDLGVRMSRTFQAAAAARVERTAIVGIDCPQVDADLLQQLFQALAEHPLVLGPAVDGGYYAIGLQKPLSPLFSGIDWGTERVRSQTVAAAATLGLQPEFLPLLADVDRPEDLAIWQQTIAAGGLAEDSVFLSIIVPTLNEAGRDAAETTCRLEQVLSKVRGLPQVETIVVDGGSEDETVAIAQAQQARVIHCDRGRARQMNAGAAAANGKVLLFLHADTVLPADFAAQVQSVLQRPNVVAGAFELAIDGDLPSLRTIERFVSWRSRTLQMPYGDQALFLSAETFRAVGGFPEQPIMEDFEFVRQLRQKGRIAIASAVVLTSGRRWQQLGVWRTTAINQLIVLGYYLGVPLARLARWYRRDRGTRSTQDLDRSSR